MRSSGLLELVEDCDDRVTLAFIGVGGLYPGKAEDNL